MKFKLIIHSLSALAGVVLSAPAINARDAVGFAATFDVKKSDFTPTGRSPFFVLEPGFQLIYKGVEDGGATVLTITVLRQTKVVDGVETRVVEERETTDGKLVEVSRNYFALSKKTGDAFYFGEDVDMYKDGRVANHEGSWLAGVKNARFGLGMPARPVPGMRYYQEVAPGFALDRAEIVSVTETIGTPAGKFTGCLKTKETSGLEKGTEYKIYAPGIGMVADGGLKLVKVAKMAS
ncbi:MAG TPA: hypothetical protein VG733_00615 [Chthoniobacteraceae bacterium]|nr:hypothetical protein [Chthoniobacteraceae bacterium]